MVWVLSGAYVVVVVLTVVTILRRRQEPMSMLAWIFAAVSLPFVGSVLYVLLGSNRVRRKAGRRRRRVQHLLSRLEKWAEQQRLRVGAAQEPPLSEELAAIEALGQRLAHFPAAGGNSVEVFHDSESTYNALRDAIASARHHIHLQYYIWQDDQTGRDFRDLVSERARAGVQCRVLLDAVGCFGLRARFLRPLLDAGVQVAFFLPLYPLRRRRWSLNLRNHRKIVVIDGGTSFVGSQNIGDEYRGRKKRLSPWFDSHMRIRGPASLFLAQVFAEDWVFATRESLTADVYFPPPGRPGDCVVQVLPSGPESDVSALAQMLFAAVSSARASVRIATPYFVPDPALRMALIHAGWRGVQVQIVLPTRSDAPLALWAGRSYYGEFIQAGVEMYEFDGGVLHSKIITVDDRLCLLGSANMDVRSFRLNFEITALIYDAPVAAEQSRVIRGHIASARRIAAAAVWRRTLREQLVEGAARLFAPLL